MPSVPDIARSTQVAAENAAAQVVDGMVRGLGSGSTAEMTLPVLGVRVREGRNIAGVPRCVRTAGARRGNGGIRDSV